MVGQRVQVIEDPSGTVSPNLPDNLDIPAYAATAAAGALGLALCLLMIARAGSVADPFWRAFGIGRKRAVDPPESARTLDS